MVIVNYSDSQLDAIQILPHPCSLSFVFNTPETDTEIFDVITDFTVSEDIIQINQQGFGASDISEFSFDQTNGALSFVSQQFATLENFADLQNFDINRDIELV